MKHFEDNISLAGTTRAVVAVMRALLKAHPDQDKAWKRLRAEYREASAGYDADPSLAGERMSFEEVFDMLGISMAEDATSAGAETSGEFHRRGVVDSVKTNLSDGVDDASIY